MVALVKASMFKTFLSLNLTAVSREPLGILSVTTKTKDRTDPQCPQRDATHAAGAAPREPVPCDHACVQHIRLSRRPPRAAAGSGHGAAAVEFDAPRCDAARGNGARESPLTNHAFLSSSSASADLMTWSPPSLEMPVSPSAMPSANESATSFSPEADLPACAGRAG